MLPPNFLTIPQIQHERYAGSKLIHLTTLLEYVLKLYNPNVTGAEEGREPKVGERVLADKHLFDNVKNVLWALRVRNSFAHVMENADFTERDHRNAVDYLVEAIGDVCGQQAIPRQVVQAIYQDPDADMQAKQEAEEKRQQAQREKELQEKKASEVKMWQSIRSGIRWVVLLTLLAVGGYFLWPKLVILYKGDNASAAVVRTEAGLALKKVREKRKQKEYGAVITQAEAAWRDGEIEFRRGNYKLAEEKYRQMIGLWDNLNTRVAESLSFEELLAEVNKLRLAARNAQAPQKATDLWNQAEEIRRNAETARKNGNLPDAKNLIIQARQQYETAQATAMTQTSETDAAAEDNSDGVTPETTPTALPEPTQTPTGTVTPRVERPRPSPPPADTGDEDDTFTIGEKEFMRYVTKRVNPVISQQVRSAGVSGPVVIGVWLSKHGHLSKASVIEGDPALRESALAALRRWSFKQYHLDRVPTEVRSEITIHVR